MTDEIDVAKAARHLSALMRRDPLARAAIVGVIAAEDCDDLAALAAKKPGVIVELVNAFTEMDLDDEAMEKWADAWKPANLELPQR